MSERGRDKGRYCMVIESKDGYCFVADGKKRKITAAKRKNIRHVTATGLRSELISSALSDCRLVTDKMLNKEIRRLKGLLISVGAPAE